MNLAELNGKRIALVLTGERDESAVFTGIARWDGSSLLMLRQEPDTPFHIYEEWHSKIRPTPEGSKKDLLGAAFFLWLYVRDLPAGTDQAEFEKTGLKWPKE